MTVFRRSCTRRFDPRAKSGRLSSYILLGTPIWLTADAQLIPICNYQRLDVAQDTGGAIKGLVRGDLFWGAGDTAGEQAGVMDARGRYFLMLPQVAAARIIAAQAR